MVVFVFEFHRDTESINHANVIAQHEGPVRLQAVKNLVRICEGENKRRGRRARGKGGIEYEALLRNIPGNNANMVLHALPLKLYSTERLPMTLHGTNTIQRLCGFEVELATAKYSKYQCQFEYDAGPGPMTGAGFEKLNTKNKERRYKRPAVSLFG